MSYLYNKRNFSDLGQNYWAIIGTNAQEAQKKLNSGEWIKVKKNYGIPGCDEVGCAFDPHDPTFIALTGNCSNCSAPSPWSPTGSGGYKWSGSGKPAWPGENPPQLPQYINNKWVCDAQTKPKLDPNGVNQYYCCPSGWKLSIVNDPAPCIKELDLYDCGPLPGGNTNQTMTCCHRVREWMPNTSDGSNPCAQFDLKASQILAPDIVITPESRQIITPGLLVAGGLAMALLLVMVYIKAD